MTCELSGILVDTVAVDNGSEHIIGGVTGDITVDMESGTFDFSLVLRSGVENLRDVRLLDDGVWTDEPAQYDAIRFDVYHSRGDATPESSYELRDVEMELIRITFPDDDVATADVRGTAAGWCGFVDVDVPFRRRLKRRLKHVLPSQVSSFLTRCEEPVPVADSLTDVGPSEAQEAARWDVETTDIDENAYERLLERTDELSGSWAIRHIRYDDGTEQAYAFHTLPKSETPPDYWFSREILEAGWDEPRIVDFDQDRQGYFRDELEPITETTAETTVELEA